MEAWKRVRANKGASGADDISIADIENYGVEKFLSDIPQTLMNNEYKAPPVKRVFIDKSDGRKRPLGIPTVKLTLIISIMRS